MKPRGILKKHHRIYANDSEKKYYKYAILASMKEYAEQQVIKAIDESIKLARTTYLRKGEFCNMEADQYSKSEIKAKVIEYLAKI